MPAPPPTSTPPPAPPTDPVDVLLVPLVPVLEADHWSCKRIIFVAAALILFLLGFVLVPVPLASGLLLWIPALLLLGVAYPPVARWVNRQEQRLPEVWRRRLRPRLWSRARRRLKRALS